MGPINEPRHVSVRALVQNISSAEYCFNAREAVSRKTCLRMQCSY
jgi:hypothetical protein